MQVSHLPWLRFCVYFGSYNSTGWPLEAFLFYFGRWHCSSFVVSPVTAGSCGCTWLVAEWGALRAWQLGLWGDTGPGVASSGAYPEVHGWSCWSPEADSRKPAWYSRLSPSLCSLTPQSRVPPQKSRCCWGEMGPTCCSLDSCLEHPSSDQWQGVGLCLVVYVSLELSSQSLGCHLQEISLLSDSSTKWYFLSDMSQYLIFVWKPKL